MVILLKISTIFLNNRFSLTILLIKVWTKVLIITMFWMIFLTKAFKIIWFKATNIRAKEAHLLWLKMMKTKIFLLTKFLMINWELGFQSRMKMWEMRSEWDKVNTKRETVTRINNFWAPIKKVMLKSLIKKETMKFQQKNINSLHLWFTNKIIRIPILITFITTLTLIFRMKNLFTKIKKKGWK